ncbi:MAG TPA: type II toxin-antitoxin system prevent-host-death family antitoxin [Firmicutes bacterium]|nr:type II toxin-antitoxin system prevent-host-death family antitoxin [Bacillota bacterium]
MEQARIRRVKTHLSEYLHRVKGGEALIIRERGKPVALLTSVQHERLPDRVLDLLQSGQAKWQEGKPKGIVKPYNLRGRQTLSSFVSEDR